MATAQLNRDLRSHPLDAIPAVVGSALTDSAALASHLFASVESGAIPPIFQVYLRVDKNPAVLQAALGQQFSASARSAAIFQLAHRLESESSFDETWNALGGAKGIDALMQGLSVNEVDRLCHFLASSPTGNPSAAFIERREVAMSELFTALINTADPRPLQSSYRHILPQCTKEVRDEWMKQQSGGEAHQKSKKPSYPPYLEPNQEIVPAQITDPTIIWLLGIEGLHEQHKKTLKVIAECKDLRIKPVEFLQQLLLHTARRMVKQRLPEGARLKMWTVIVDCLERWPQIAEHKSNRDSLLSLLKHAIHWWNYAPTQQKHGDAETVLQRFLQLLPKSRIPGLGSSAGLFVGTRARKYELLRMCALQRYGVGLGSVSEQDHETLGRLLKDEMVEAALFTQLPADKALALLDFLAEARPDKKFLKTMGYYFWGGEGRGLSIMSQRGEISDSYADFDILRTLLLSVLGPLSPEARAHAEEGIKTRMEKSAKSRDQDDRVFWAKSALFMSTSTGSPELYAKTLLWARRFDKDYYVVSNLYSEVLQAREGVVLLGGIPTAAQLPIVPLAKIQEDIAAGNKIILQLLEAAGDAIQEPHFNRYHWSQLRHLVSDVVRTRLELVNALQAHHSLSDDQIYDLVWEPTLAVLTEVEDIAIREENDALCFAQPSGLVDPFALVGLRDHAWKFLDNLARVRDELWRKERIRRSPGVLSLDVIMPQGLPVHSLCDFTFKNLPLRLPYVVSRAQKIVFADAETLFSPMPTDGETRDQIGCFIDDFAKCVKIYVNGWDGAPGDRYSRLDQVRRHLDKVAGGKMTEEEARNFWQDHVFGPLSSSLPKPREAASSKKAGLQFPQVEDSSEPIEWYPDPTWRGVKGSQRMVPGALSYLECLVEAKYEDRPYSPNPAFKAYPLPSKKILEIKSSPSFWDLGRFARPLSGETQDVYIAAALLAINSRAGADPSLLMQPFPSASDDRFPAVYLADEFLESAVDGDSNALQACFDILKAYQTRVPPRLLLQLAASMLKRVRSGEKTLGEHRRLTMEVLSLLSRGERPSASFGLIRNVIIDGQGDSAWHRHLINIGFFNNLPAEQARAFTQELADLMVERLRSQAASKEVVEDEDSPRTPRIKVTTVKMLAQILNGAEHIDSRTALTILTKILANATHPDIRAAVIDSIVGIFTSSASDRETRTEALSTLALHAVPVAASPDEREPMSEEKWKAAEAAEELPEVKRSWDRPIYTLLLGTRIYSDSDEWNKRWASDIIEKVLKLSMENNRRWLDLFLRKYNLGTAASFPAVPLYPDLFGTFLASRFDYTTDTLFDYVADYTLKGLTSPEIASVNTKLRANARLIPSNALNHWEHLFGRSAQLHSYAIQATSLLTEPANVWSRASKRGLSPALVQDFILDVANIYLGNADVDNFTSLVSHLAHFTTRDRDKSRASWLANSLPLLRRLRNNVEALRTPEWQRDVRRQPSRLPDGFTIRYKMLVYPSTQFNEDKEPAPQGEIDAFAGEIKDLVHGLVASGLPYHAQWGKLKTAVMSDPLSGADYLRVALALVQKSAADGEEDTLAYYLLVELAMDLMREAKDPKSDEVVNGARELLVTRWSNDAVEEVRKAAREVVFVLQRKSGDTWVKTGVRDKFEETHGKGSFLGVEAEEPPEPVWGLFD